MLEHNTRRTVLAILLIAPTAALAQYDPTTDPRATLDSPIVPVHHEPHHRQLFQFGPTRILELQIPPNDMAWFHTHEWPVLYMTLSSSPTRSQVLGEEWSGGGRRGGPPPGARGGGPGTTPGGARTAGPGGAPAAARGGPPPAAPGGPGVTARGGQTPAAGPTAPRAFSSTNYFENPVTHRLANVGDELFRAMVVVNETAGNESLSPEAAGFDDEPELTNAWFRSYRIRLDPGAATSSHEHLTPVVIMQGTEGHGMASGPMNFEFNEPGQWAFYDAGTTHTIRNSGSETMEWLEIEVRLE
jgi:hypothetical protein